MSTFCVREDLTVDVVSSYDQTKNTIQGRVFSKSLLGETVLGPPLTSFIDVFTDTTGFGSVTPSGVMAQTDNNRLFILGTISGGLAPIVLYNFNLATGAYSFVGKIIVTLPNAAATTHTATGFKVVDSGVTGWKLFLSTTGSVLINGGPFLINSINLSDFTPSGTTIPVATGSNQKAVYFLQNSAAIGVNHIMTAIKGNIIDTVGTKIYVHNGVAATHQYHWFDYSGTPDVPGQTFTVTIATPGVVTATAHGYNNNDQVALYTTGTLPTGLTASVAGVSQAVYFVRNVTANTFELSATSGGASIATSGAQSGTHTVRRAFGITGSLTYQATGNLPALTGTLLAVNNENKHTPAQGPNNAQACFDLATSSNLYRIRQSDITNGTTTLPNLETFNVLSSAITGPTVAFSSYLESVQKWVYQTNTAKFVQKSDGNNTIDRIFGSLFNKFLEAMNPVTVNFGFPAITGFENKQGWLFISSSTVGVRGVVAMDLRSDAQFDYSMIVSKVFTVNSATLKNLSTIEGLFESTGTVALYYRTSGFGSISGGWVAVNTAEDLSIALGSLVQLKVLFDIANEDASTPAQMIALLLALQYVDQSDDNWVGSVENSSSGSPTKVTFRLQYAYESGTVPTLEVAIVDDNDNITQTYRTDTNAANFRYSTNNGTSWNALGTIPNVALTTELECTLSSPPGVPVRGRIRTV